MEITIDLFLNIIAYDKCYNFDVEFNCFPKTNLLCQIILPGNVIGYILIDLFILYKKNTITRQQSGRKSLLQVLLKVFQDVYQMVHNNVLYDV